MIRTSSNLGVKLGALVAATSLMLGGGAAVASAAYAKDNPNKPDKGNSANPNAPGQNSANGPGGATTPDKNGGAQGGDNGGANRPGENANGDDLQGGTGTVRVNICHATRSAQNPYVLITVDASSVDEAYLLIYGKGNGHGDHVGNIWDGQRSGVNWGDIISAFGGTTRDGRVIDYPGYNLGASSKDLGGTGAEILGNGCQPLKPLQFGDSTTICAIQKSSGATTFSEQTVSVPQEYATPEAATAALNEKVANEYTVSADPASSDPAVGCGTPAPQCVDGVNGPFPGNLCSAPPGSVSATSGVALCEVVDGAYTQITSVTTTGSGADAAAAQLDADTQARNAAAAKSTGDNIIKPVTLSSGVEVPGYNWTEETEAIWDAGCSPNAQVVSWHTGKASWPEIRRWIRQRKLVPIETVRLTEHCGFVEAIEAGVEALSERRDFDSMLDIVTARMANVTPLPVREE